MDRITLILLIIVVLIVFYILRRISIKRREHYQRLENCKSLLSKVDVLNLRSSAPKVDKQIISDAEESNSSKKKKRQKNE